MRVHLTLKSRNEKTGPIPVSTSSPDTCPPSCPLKGKGCYAQHGPLGIHWRAVAKDRGTDWAEFCHTIANLPEGQLWRHNQAGDLPAFEGDAESIDNYKLAELTLANKSRRGFTYTHKGTTESNREAIRSANRHGFTINLSADSFEEADKLADTKAGPVVVTLPQNESRRHTPQGRRIVVCPAQVKDGITCETCSICQKANRKVIIGFLAHGAGAKYV